MGSVRRISIRVLIIFVFLALWEWVGSKAGSLIFPPITQVIKTYPELIISGALGKAFWVSMKALIVGYGLSIIVGVLLGLLLGRFETLNDVLDPYVNALYATPRAGLVPLILIWFGVGFAGRTFIIFLGGVLPILINTVVGVRNVNRDLIEVGQSFCASQTQLFREIILPAALPYVAAGLRIGFGRAIVGVIVAEFFLEIVGLGGLIVTYGDTFSTDKMIAVILVVSLVGVALTRLIQYVEEKAIWWSQAGAEL